MDQILEFIFGNFMFVLIVIGGLMSVFKRMNNEQQQKQPKKELGWPGQQQRQDKVDWQEILKKEEEINPESQKPKRVYLEVDPVIKEKILQPSVNVVSNVHETYHHRETLNVKQPEVNFAKKSSPNDFGLNRLTNKDFLKGIVWAEVLGPPRAKKQHQALMKKR
ncbi:hypothetical protein GN156_16550 [bacterium LRH843]|nr:hypothetical protein [bacterium LRH843]